MAAREGEAALLAADDYVGRAYPIGFCLRWVREQYRIPALWPSAAAAWLHAEHRHQAGPGPRGYPMFWQGGASGFGHVAISAGNGFIYTTDLPRGGFIGLVDWLAPARQWGLTYAGWTADLNGQSVWCPTVDLSRLQDAASKHPWRYPYGTLRLQRSLRARGLLAARFCTGWYNQATRDAYKAWERRIGYQAGIANHVPDLPSLRRLGRYEPFLIVRA